MVDWTSGTNDASVAERDSGFVIVRIPGTPDVLKEAPVNGFVTKDAGGNVGIGTSSQPTFRFVAANNTFDGVGMGSSGTYSFITLGGYFTGTAGAAQLGFERSTGAFVIGNGSRDNPTERMRITSAGNVLAGTSNTQDLGAAGLSWRNGFIQNAWTVTSDADLKQRGAGLSDNEILAGKRIADELVWWKWLKSIADKGAAARNHFGPMAQDIAQILVECDVELDWADGKPSFRSDMLCWDEWDAVTQPVMAERIVQKTKIVLVPVDGSDDGTGEPFYKREEITVDEVEQYDTGAVEIVRPAGSEWRIDPSQVAFFLIAAINADTERRLALLEGAKS